MTSCPNGQPRQQDPEAKPEWLNRAVDTLATRILENVNRAAHVNPINLLAISLLSTPKHAMTESRSRRADRSLQGAARRAPVFGSRHDDRRSRRRRSSRTARRWAGSSRVAHPLGDVLGVDDEGRRAALVFPQQRLASLRAGGVGRVLFPQQPAHGARVDPAAGAARLSVHPVRTVPAVDATRNSPRASRRRSSSSSRADCSAPMPTAA